MEGLANAPGFEGAGNPSKRFAKELKEVRKENDPDIYLEPLKSEGITVSFEWKGAVRGPKDSPFEGGVFHLRIMCPSNYPFGAPKIWFKTKCFHPNVHWETGELCLDVLKTEWSPAWSLTAVLRAIIAVLSDPNADSPLNCDAGNLIRNGDMRGFKSMAKMYTIEEADGEFPQMQEEE